MQDLGISQLICLQYGLNVVYLQKGVTLNLITDLAIELIICHWCINKQKHVNLRNLINDEST